MKKVFLFTTLIGVLSLILTACARIDETTGGSNIDSSPVPPVTQTLTTDRELQTPTAVQEAQTAVQLVVYMPDGSLQVVDQNILLETPFTPVFNSFLPAGGSVAGTAYVVDSTKQTKVVAIDANGAHDLSFISKPTTFGLAVWRGNPESQPRLAWGTQPDDSNPSSTLQISALDGSQLETLLTLDVSTQPLQLVAEFWSPDGQSLYFSKEPMGLGGYILFGGASNLFRIDISTRQVTEIIPAGSLSGPQACLDAISADYRFVADHCSQKTITVRDLLSGETTTVQPPVEVSAFGALGSAHFSPDGSRLAFALAQGDPNNEQGWVAVSDSTNGESKLVLTSQKGTYDTIAGWLDDQTLLVQATNLLECTPYCNSEIWAVSVNTSNQQKVADGNLLTVITDSADKEPSRTTWDQPTSAQSTAQVNSSPICFSPDEILPVAFMPGSPSLVVRESSGVQIFDLKSGKPDRFIPSSQEVVSVALSPDGKTLAWGLRDYTIQLVRLTDQKILANLSGHPDPAYHLQFSPTGDKLFSASHDGLVRIWDMNGKQLTPIEAGSQVLGIGLSGDGAKLATIPFDGPVALWDLSDNKKIAELGGSGGYDTSDIVFSPDGQHLAADLAAGIFLWQLSDNSLVWSAVKNSMAVAFSPDGRYLAYSDIDNGNKIFLVSPDRAKVIDTIEGMQGPVGFLFFSSDGSLLAAADGTEIHIWRVEDGALLYIGKTSCS